jgi:hypothetical protein
MKEPFYRIANLSLDAELGGYGWRCWIIVQGTAKPANGFVALIGDLEAALKEKVANRYQEVTGKVLPDSAL